MLHFDFNKRIQYSQFDSSMNFHKTIDKVNPCKHVYGKQIQPFHKQIASPSFFYGATFCTGKMEMNENEFSVFYKMISFIVQQFFSFLNCQNE